MRMPPEEARRRLAAARVATLATISPDGEPHVVPVTFAADEDAIYTAVDAKPKRTSQLRRLGNIRANPRVAVLADLYDEDWSALWWARADGLATILDDEAAMTAPIRLLSERYPQYQDIPPTGPVIAIRVLRWTGWSAT